MSTTATAVSVPAYQIEGNVYRFDGMTLIVSFPDLWLVEEGFATLYEGTVPQVVHGMEALHEKLRDAAETGISVDEEHRIHIQTIKDFLACYTRDRDEASEFIAAANEACDFFEGYDFEKICPSLFRRDQEFTCRYGFFREETLTLMDFAMEALFIQLRDSAEIGVDVDREYDIEMETIQKFLARYTQNRDEARKFVAEASKSYNFFDNLDFEKICPGHFYKDEYFTYLHGSFTEHS